MLICGLLNDGISIDGVNNTTASTHLSSLVKQREYRRSDGRKRIIPEAVGVPIQQEHISGVAQCSFVGFPNTTSDHRKDENGIVPTDASVREASTRKAVGASADQKERSGVSARATISESLIIEKVSLSAGKDGSISREQMGVVKDPTSLGAGKTLVIRMFDKKEGEDTGLICLEARPREQAANDILGAGNSFVMKETELVCTRGSQIFWSDRISGKVTVLAEMPTFGLRGVKMEGFRYIQSVGDVPCQP